MKEKQWAINWTPKTTSFAQLCSDRGMSHQSVVRIVDDYIKESSYTKHVNGKAIVMTDDVTGSQYYISIESGMIIGGVPQVGNILVSSNVRDDLIKIIDNV